MVPLRPKFSTPVRLTFLRRHSLHRNWCCHAQIQSAVELVTLGLTLNIQEVLNAIPTTQLWDCSSHFWAILQVWLWNLPVLSIWVTWCSCMDLAHRWDINILLDPAPWRCNSVLLPWHCPQWAFLHMARLCNQVMWVSLSSLALPSESIVVYSFASPRLCDSPACALPIWDTWVYPTPRQCNSTP